MDASHSDADKMIANNTWDLIGLSMEDNHQQQQQINLHDSQLPFYHNSFYWPPQPPNHFLNPTYHHHQLDYKPLTSLALTPTATTTLDFINYDQYQQQLQQQQEDDDDDKDDDEEEEGEEGEKEEEEELGALKELMYNMAAMQPVDIDPATLHKPKRRNVRISNDPQSVAARQRRQRISEKIQILQRLVPGGTRMDTASMLDEAARYVKFLKRLIRRLQMNIAGAAPTPATHFPEPSGDHWPLPPVIADTPSSSATQQQQREEFGTTEEQQQQLRGCWRYY